MVDITPFRGLVYNESMIGDISKVISPPYDVVSSSLKKELYNSHPYNIINLIRPKGNAGNKYKRAKILLTEWIKKNILKLDDSERFYIFEENFNFSGKTRKISGFIGLTRIEPYSKLQIIPHEKTSTSVKKDRLKLLSECRTNFGVVFTLYNDSSGEIKNILENNIQNKPEINTHAGYDPDLRFKLWKITGIKEINQIISIMKNMKLIIADGHHRYETSLIYKNEYNKKLDCKREPNQWYPEDFILTLYIDSRQNNFFILPTYRSIKFKNYPSLEKILDKINNTFDIEENTLKSAGYLNEKLSKSKSSGLKSFFLYSKEKKLYFITLKTSCINNINHKSPTDRDYSSMDINIFHKFFMESISSQHEIGKIDYSHSIDDVINNIDSKKFDIGIFLNAPTVKELERISTTGYLMPEKSTYFYPKPCTGLVMYKFDYGDNSFTQTIK